MLYVLWWFETGCRGENVVVEGLYDDTTTGGGK